MSKRVAVIGCGVFGALAALRLADAGFEVTVFERRSTLLLGASYNNQNRLHLGFHYPRDEETAQQCIRGFEAFRSEFEPSVLAPNVNAYFVASEGSLTSAEDYLAFADRINVPYTPIDLDTFAPEVRNVDIGFAVPEVIYDCGILRHLLEQRLLRSSVQCLYGWEVSYVDRRGEGFIVDSAWGPKFFDAVVNCTYADTNRLGESLGHALSEYQYEFTAIPIVEWKQPPIGITIMDGRFMTVLPFGRTGRFLLYHVEHAVEERVTATQMPSDWRYSYHRKGRNERFARVVDDCCKFVPSLSEVNLVGWLDGPRVVLARRDDTDARPSIISSPEPRYINIFSGKIDHCMWASEEAVRLLREVL